MSCMPKRMRRLQMHTVVDQPLTASARGRISCRPIGMEPIDFEWTGPSGAPVEVDASGSEALEVVPGRYRVIATDATGSCADLAIDVEPMLTDAVIVTAYDVVPASTATARDGAVEARGVGLEGVRFLWTNGMQTTGPRLRDVPCGTYALTPLPADPTPTLVHQCPPARVGVSAAGPLGE